jgi:hypothetical protein
VIGSITLPRWQGYASNPLQQFYASNLPLPADTSILTSVSGPTTATIKKLFAVSGNQCAFPDCTLPLVDSDSGTVLGEICHIKARSPDGPRYDHAQTDKERHEFENLLLLCPAHHKIVDENPDEYTVEELRKIKREHETHHAGGREPSDEVVQQLLVQLNVQGDITGQVAIGRNIVQIGNVFGGVVNITLGLDKLPTRYDGRVRNFLEYYVGMPESPAPFGGRAADLAALDAWLTEEDASPYALLVAPAGRGKSALLAHWVTRLTAEREADGVHVVYFPVSIRFNTNLESVAFAALAARIAHIYGEPVTQAIDAQQYRGVFSDYLRREPPDGGNVLVVIDGLDEAAGWEAGADLFPQAPPSHLRVVVAARPLAGDADEGAWLSRLGWERLSLAQRLTLGGLDRAGVSDVLAQMGNPLGALAPKGDVVGRLHELSEGDPLLVRLYVEALLPHGEQAAAFEPEDLATLEPGLDAYFHRWFEEQRKLWGSRKPLQDRAVRGLLNLCAMALGPLMREDVLALASDEIEDGWILDEATRTVNRFVIGDGENRGYVFSHPRLSEYFAGRLTAQERRDWQERFLHYGRETLIALEEGPLAPGEAPAYAVQHYGAHLEQAEAPSKELYDLMCEGWLRAWEWVEGTPAGFLGDVNRGWKRAEAEGGAAVGKMVRAALCIASVASVSANIPDYLLLACVRRGVISPSLGLVMARSKPDPQERTYSLVGIAEFLPSAQRESVLCEALAAAHEIGDEGTRADALGVLAERLSEDQREAVLGEALAAARLIEDEQHRANALGALAEQLLKDRQEAVLSEALTAARLIENEQHRTEALGMLVERLPKSLLGKALIAACEIRNEDYRTKALVTLAERLPKSLLRKALASAHKIEDEWCRTRALSALAQLSEKNQEAILSEALATAREIKDDWRRAEALAALAEQPLGENREAILNEALATAREVKNDWRRARALGKIARQEDSVGEALAAARGVKEEESRADALGALLTWLPKNRREGVVEEALAAAREIEGKWACTEALIALAEQLPIDQRDGVLAEALTSAREITSEFGEFGRMHALDRLVELLPEDLLSDLLTVVHEFKQEGFRARLLWKLTEQLQEDQQRAVLSEVLAVARKIRSEEYYARTMSALAERLVDKKKQETSFAEALAATREIEDRCHRTHTLIALARRLPANQRGPVLSETLTIACTTTSIQDYKFPDILIALAALADQLPDEKKREIVLGEILAAACTIESKSECTFGSIELTEWMPESLSDSLTEKTLDAARETKDKAYRACLLSALAKRLLNKEKQDILFKEALATANKIKEEYILSYVLIKLAGQLPESLLDQVLAIACRIGNKLDRVDTLLALAKRLQDEEHETLLGEALIAAQGIENEWNRAYALLTLAERLQDKKQETLFNKALVVARGIDNEWDRADALFALAKRLQDKEQEILFKEILAAAYGIEDEWERINYLGLQAELLPEKLLGEGVLLAHFMFTKRVLYDSEEGSELYDFVLSKRMLASRTSDRQLEWQDLSATLRTFAKTGRNLLLGAIEALLPVIERLGGLEALEETVKAVMDTAQWWP